MILRRQRHCLVQYPEKGKARREEGGKHLCSGLTSWKRIKSSCTTKKVLKEVFSLTEMRMTGYLQEKRVPATKRAKQHLTCICKRRRDQPAPHGRSRSPPRRSHHCKQTAPSRCQVKDSRHQEPTLHFDAGYHKGLVLEQAAQFFMSRLNVIPLVTMQIFCYLRKFTWIMLPQLFQRITRSSSSVPHSASQSSQAVAKGRSNQLK